MYIHTVYKRLKRNESEVQGGFQKYKGERERIFILGETGGAGQSYKKRKHRGFFDVG